MGVYRSGSDFVSFSFLISYRHAQKPAGKIPLKDETPRNLVTEKAGTVVSMVVRAGKAAVQPGDEVEEGQLLVEGIIPITDDSGEVVRNLFVRADADILLQTQESYRETVPRFEQIQSYTGKEQTGFRLRIGRIDLLAMLPVQKKKLWEVTRAGKQLVLFEDFYLPVWAEKITAREYEVVERKRKNTEE